MNPDESEKIKWNEDDSRDFIDYGKYFIPQREYQIERICDFVSPPAGPCHLVELCCGEGLLARALIERHIDCNVHGFDGSKKMVERARDALDEYGDRFDVRLFDLADRGWRKFAWPVHAVVTSLAVHHLDDKGKQELFRDMVNALEPRGVLVIADLVAPTSQADIDLAAKEWDLAVRDRSLELDGNLDAFNKFREMEWNIFSDPDPDPGDMLSPLSDQLKWLEQAGFIEADVFWEKAGHTIFGGSKPSPMSS